MAVDRAPLSGLADVASRPHVTVHLDDTDRRILVLLAEDARLSQRALARQLHMSPPAIGERLARLERVGVIRGYRVDIDWAALGYVTGYLAVTAVQGADQSEVMRGLHQLPEVQEVMVITGSMDMLARVRVRDYTHLRKFLLERVWQMPGIQRTETFLSLAEMPSKEASVDLLGSDDEDVTRSSDQG
ncbi:transcriptional regulator, AsnC family [Pseudonocardia dioxanivorans CB1190]|uniref:Transcriptional regulator, AsnC family n=1 Tax=Pseudonocardia dioxanivorans (strain ATCC 55486 / DSM 44775 / JCM 13855 / CB1190) TaxID=675635 RepID=F4CK18_PSEUX|nr:Lrp/AsnC family transcriptional regulator [Pseudonocardia dioxanivorans]AEA28124.1 transcriptional regulator, AsnC family [Pseudonocardia dioxanivorans CB1190]